MAETRRKQAPACLLQPQVGVQWVPDGMVASRDAGSAVGEHHRGHRGTTMSARGELRVFENGSGRPSRKQNSVGHYVLYPNTALFNPPPKKLFFPGRGLSSLGRITIMLNSQGCVVVVVVVVVYPCFCPKGGNFSQRAAQ